MKRNSSSIKVGLKSNKLGKVAGNAEDYRVWKIMRDDGHHYFYVTLLDESFVTLKIYNSRCTYM